MKFYNNDNKYGIQSDIKDFFFLFLRRESMVYILHYTNKVIWTDVDDDMLWKHYIIQEKLGL